MSTFETISKFAKRDGTKRNSITYNAGKKSILVRVIFSMVRIITSYWPETSRASRLIRDRLFAFTSEPHANEKKRKKKKEGKQFREWNRRREIFRERDASFYAACISTNIRCLKNLYTGN